MSKSFFILIFLLGVLPLSLQGQGRPTNYVNTMTVYAIDGSPQGYSHPGQKMSAAIDTITGNIYYWTRRDSVWRQQVIETSQLTGQIPASQIDGLPSGIEKVYLFNDFGITLDSTIVGTDKKYIVGVDTTVMATLYDLSSTLDTVTIDVTQISGISMYSPLSYQYSVASDGENNFSIPFTLEEGAMIFYNGWIIDDIEWDGNGTNVLDLDFPTSENDKLSVNTGMSYYQSTTHKYEVPSDGIVNITVPFELKSTTLVFFNGWLVDNTLWTGVGTTTLTLLVGTAKYDLIIVNLH